MFKIMMVIMLLSAVFAFKPEKHEFDVFIKKYNKNHTGDEYEKRYNIYAKNVETIRKHNSEIHSWKLKVNKWADHSWEEFKEKRLGYIARPIANLVPPTSGHIEQVLKQTAGFLDWRTKGVVTSVKDQGQCGSCWAFSAISTIESAYAIKTGKLYSLSEQQLIDCSSQYSNYGCNGGLPDNAFTYAENIALCNETQYSYIGSEHTCKVCSGKVKVNKYVNIPSLQEYSIYNAVLKQPVSVAIEADKNVFQFYSSGVFDNEQCGYNIDHAVVIDGFGTENSLDYWLVRNSWGPEWGENGYIKMVRGKNICGIALQASYPVI